MSLVRLSEVACEGRTGMEGGIGSATTGGKWRGPAIHRDRTALSPTVRVPLTPIFTASAPRPLQSCLCTRSTHHIATRIHYDYCTVYPPVSSLHSLSGADDSPLFPPSHPGPDPTRHQMMSMISVQVRTSGHTRSWTTRSPSDHIRVTRRSALCISQ